jgi:hypothetical protein
VNKAENVVEDFRVVGVLFKTDKFNVDQIEAFVGFRQEFAEKVIHETLALNTWRARCCAFRGLASLLVKRLIFVEQKPNARANRENACFHAVARMHGGADC